ncbi:MAG TPA: class I SAM-dependent methyltransferase [Ktedonosporobacter sp.]|nr:class I SAM-dependent methyltransferase [Ktedonosporobacter sp.]
MTTDPSKNHTYILDPESPVEMARLIHFDQITTKAMGGPLTEQPPEVIASLHYVLDLACGPGGWVLDVAFAYPEMDVAGVDISKTMINYAGARARTQKLTNASFGIMDITHTLDFSESIFDLVNARFINGVLHRDAWAPFLAECRRLLRPGGILRLTEMVDVGVSNSPAFEQMSAWLSKVMWKLGYGFSPDGSGLGITSMLSRLLRTAGYMDIQRAAHTLEFSIEEEEAWTGFYHNMEVGYALAKPIFVKTEVALQEEFEQCYQQMLIEMHAATFCGLWDFVTVWGKKP